MADENKSNVSKSKKQKEWCSFCGREQSLPGDFIPSNIEVVTTEGYDPETGCFVVVKKIALLACKFCHQEMFSAKRMVKPKPKK